MNPLRVRTRTCDWFAGPWELYQALSLSPPCALLESARSGPHTGRYSILASEPFLAFRFERGMASLTGPGLAERNISTGDPMRSLRTLARAYRAEPSGALPPFVGGLIGYLSYEAKDYLLPRASSRLRGELELPEMYFLFFDRALVWDHAEKKVIFCQADGPGLPERPPRSLESWEDDCRRSLAAPASRLRPGTDEAPEPEMDIRCSMRQDKYEEGVREVQKEIRSGEIFQANLTHRLRFRLPFDSREVYRRLRALNPSPFFGLLEAGDFEIVSGSPERLLRLRGRELDTRPIAGTRKRGRDWKQDERLSAELLLSEKERAEHVMLVDLERNDLGRVCEFGSVHADELMTVEHYSHVQHIVSNVRGRLREDLDALDALGAFFPGGTITGAPKIRCMQILDALENVPRGAYTGSLGYLSFTGDMDMNILIRSLSVKDGEASLHVGAGIVADSDPEKEYHETLYKAEAVLQAVFGPRNVREFFRERGLAARVP